MSEQIPFIQPMTAEQTIQALECCIDNNVNACDNCPIDKHIKDDCKCCQYLAENALSLIKELKTEYSELVSILSKQAAENEEKDSKERGMMRVPVRISQLWSKQIEYIVNEIIEKYKPQFDELEISIELMGPITMDFPKRERGIISSYEKTFQRCRLSPRARIGVYVYDNPFEMVVQENSETNKYIVEQIVEKIYYELKGK